jgi:hypothetical protein
MGACEQCDGGGNCLSTTCNKECRHLGDVCETIFMGGINGREVEGMTKKQKAGLARFLPCFIIENCTELMLKAGIAIGDLVTHVNGKFPQDLRDFAALVESLPAGTVLKIWRQDGMREDVTL